MKKSLLYKLDVVEVFLRICVLLAIIFAIGYCVVKAKQWQAKPPTSLQDLFKGFP